jgi:hypothetical protein
MENPLFALLDLKVIIPFLVISALLAMLSINIYLKNKKKE